MSLNAVALLQIPPSVVLDALPAAPDAPGKRAAKNGLAVTVDTFEDAAAVHLGCSLAQEPEALRDRLLLLLGDLLSAHADPRGVPIFPDSYTPTATRWAELTLELGEAADWVRVAPAADPMAAMFGAGVPDLASLMGGMGGMPDMQAMAAQMGGMDPASMMEQAMKMAQQMAADGSLASLLGSMGGAMPSSPEEAMRALESAKGSFGGTDIDALAAQAQAMLADNPELEAALAKSIGAAQGGGSEGTDESE